MSRNKMINRCEIQVDYYGASPPVKITAGCTYSQRDPCCFYVSKTKIDRGICKHVRDWGYYCGNPEARKAAAQKVIQALQEIILDK
jgi:hypothetical protein